MIIVDFRQFWVVQEISRSVWITLQVGKFCCGRTNPIWARNRKVITCPSPGEKTSSLLRLLGYFWGPIPWMIEMAAMTSLWSHRTGWKTGALGSESKFKLISGKNRLIVWIQRRKSKLDSKTNQCSWLIRSINTGMSISRPIRMRWISVILPVNHPWYHNLVVSRMVVEYLGALQMSTPESRIDINTLKQKYHLWHPRPTVAMEWACNDFPVFRLDLVCICSFRLRKNAALAGLKWVFFDCLPGSRQGAWAGSFEERALKVGALGEDKPKIRGQNG